MKPYQPEDPMTLQGVVIPAGDLDEQARIMIEEFLMMGTPGKELFHLFSDPFYTGAYQMMLELGPERIKQLIVECIPAPPAAPSLTPDKVWRK